jgi:hypothetical protein
MTVIESVKSAVGLSDSSGKKSKPLTRNQKLWQEVNLSQQLARKCPKPAFPCNTETLVRTF